VTTRRDFIELAAAATLASCTHTPPPIAKTPHPNESSTTMRTRPLITLRLTTAPTQNMGPRTTFPITGGTFEGERLRGKVLPGGDDWAIKRADGVVELDLRATLETDDGVLIHMTFEGIRDDAAPGAPYFRTLPRFATTTEGKYAFLNKLLAVGVGEIRPDGPVHLIEEIL
jgi:hypothetical protein